MSTALSVLSSLLGRATGGFFAGITSAAGTVDSLVDAAGATNLLSYPDGYWEDGYVRITDATSSAYGDVRKIKSFSQSTGTLAPYGAFTAAPGNGKTYELYKVFHPTNDLDQAVIDVIGQRQLYPLLHRNYEYDNLVSGSRLLNGSFEDWALATTPDNWTAGADLTLTKDTTAPFHGIACVKAVATDATTLSQSFVATATSNAMLLGEYTVTFYAWVWSDGASKIRLYITSGGVTTYGAYHDGDGEWERLSVEATIDATGTVTFGFDMAAETYYLDDAYNIGGLPLYEYTIPSAIQIERNAFEVELQDSRDYPKGCYTKIDPVNYNIIPQTDGTRLLRFRNRPSDGYHIRVRGMGHLSALTTGASTIEIDAPQTELVIAQAAVNLYQRGQQGDKQMDEATQAQRLSLAQMRLAQAKAAFGMKSPATSRINRRW